LSRLRCAPGRADLKVASHLLDRRGHPSSEEGIRNSYFRRITSCGFVFLLLFAADLFAQAPAGNEKFDQKQYAEAANAYERIPTAQRDAGIYNRLGISYHLTNQLKAAENAYRAALRLQADNADALNNLAALYYSQRKFSDAERQVRRALEK